MVSSKKLEHLEELLERRKIGRKSVSTCSNEGAEDTEVCIFGSAVPILAVLQNFLDLVDVDSAVQGHQSVSTLRARGESLWEVHPRHMPRVRHRRLEAARESRAERRREIAPFRSSLGVVLSVRGLE